MRYKTLGRVIARSDEGCFVVIPAWDSKVAVYMETLPPKFNGDLPYRWYVTVDLDSEYAQDLKPEWES